LFDIKNGENQVIFKNKRHFRVQRTKIDNPAALEHYFELCSRYYVNFTQKYANMQKKRVFQIFLTKYTL
jgi:hypothetical protein